MPGFNDSPNLTDLLSNPTPSISNNLTNITSPYVPAIDNTTPAPNPAEQSISTLQSLGLLSNPNLTIPQVNQSVVPNNTTSIPTQPAPEPAPVSKLANFGVGDTSAAVKDVNNTLDEEVNTNNQAANDTIRAEAAKANRVAAVQQSFSTDLAKLDTAHTMAREQAHQDAARETAAWMKDQDALATREPSPGHWWSNQSNFAKAMWALSVGLGGLSQSYGGKNFGAEMVMKGIDSDIAEQKATQQRQLQLGKDKGQLMLSNQTQSLNDVNDDYTHKVGRLNSLMTASLTRANSASTEDAKAAHSKVAAMLADEKLKIAHKRLDSAFQEKTNIIDQNFESSRNN